MSRAELPLEGDLSIVVENHENETFSVVWPTELTAKQMIGKVLEVLSENPESSGWETQVVATRDLDNPWQFIETEDYLEGDEPYGIEDGYPVRFNAGDYPEGFSVTAYTEGSNVWLSANFAPDSPFVGKVIEATISPQGAGKAEEAIALGT